MTGAASLRAAGIVAFRGPGLLMQAGQAHRQAHFRADAGLLPRGNSTQAAPDALRATISSATACATSMPSMAAE